MKLTGEEKATPEDQRAADEFLRWFTDNVIEFRAYLATRCVVDDDVLSASFLKVYDGIALRGYRVKDFRSYFERAYFTNAAAKAWSADDPRFVSIDSLVGSAQVRNIPAPDFNYGLYEQIADLVSTTVLDYVNGQYEPRAAALFEQYVQLQPDISYKKLSDLTGVPLSAVWKMIGPIRKDVVARFGSWKDALMTLL